VSMRDVYLNPTVAKLAEHLRHHADETVTRVHDDRLRFLR
jgi:hypothetical protein